MTVAICIYCGSVKGGAFVPCSSCGKTPDNEDDMVRSFVLTDHHFPVAQLQYLSEKIKSGSNLDLQIDDSVMQRMKAALKLLGASGIAARRSGN